MVVVAAAILGIILTFANIPVLSINDRKYATASSVSWKFLFAKN